MSRLLRGAKGIGEEFGGLMAIRGARGFVLIGCGGHLVRCGRRAPGLLCGGRMVGCRKLLRVVRRVVEGFGLGPGGYVVVFGSAAEGRCSGLSDVDLAVRGFSPVEAGRLAEAVEAETGRRVEVVLVERASLPLLYEALVRGAFVGGDYQAFVEDRWRALVEWLDYREAYEEMHRSYRRRVLAV
ncbi:hypothetical protein PABY_13650 [Pyrodictium abyssi]|uniref:Polymerase nucleotidyl transferase domain-containing protein n=1 Tax=Pyrodictium abyssi TaxID=54256 RepID=A0ABM8IZQ5_9CREN|nr:hypothetical protein PABY_13650 [Pyrodictium abyssi]